MSGGSLQIAKSDGKERVRRHILAVPGWKREVSQRQFPSIQLVREGHVFDGMSLKPVPPGGEPQEARWINILQGELNEDQLTSLFRQAATMPGLGRF